MELFSGIFLLAFCGLFMGDYFIYGIVKYAPSFNLLAAGWQLYFCEGLSGKGIHEAGIKRREL
jgi:hypothetical protein